MFEDYTHQRTKRKFDFDIRPAADDDINDIVRLSLVREAGDVEKIRESVNAYIADGLKSFVLVAVVDNRLVGFGKAKHMHGGGVVFPGWYLSGLVVSPDYRNANIGSALTVSRIEKIRSLASEVYYFANASNLVTIDLHEKLGFKLIQEPFEFPKVTFSNSHGQLYLKRY